jgi:hypothetical protein
MPTLTDRSDLGDFMYALYEEQYDFQEAENRHYDKENDFLNKWKQQFYTHNNFDEDKTYNWFMKYLEENFVLIPNKVLRQCLKFSVVCIIATVVRHEIEDHIKTEEERNAPL